MQIVFFRRDLAISDGIKNQDNCLYVIKSKLDFQQQKLLPKLDISPKPQGIKTNSKFWF